MESLDVYELMPRAMRSYLANYGWNFSSKACDFAVKHMKRINPATGKQEPVDTKTKEQVEEILKKNGVKLDNNKGHNFVFVYNMGLADYMRSSIADEAHLCLYVKDVIDDVDNKGGNVFRKWYVDMIAKGEPVIWEDLL